MEHVLYSDDVAYCRKVAKKFGKSYAFATRFFPKETRDATYILYAFFRFPDEIVDTQHHASQEQKQQQLRAWQNSWKQAYAGNMKNIPPAWVPVLRGASVVFHTYGIPFAYSSAFLSAMEQDLTKEAYATYEDLKRYMYGSAAVVGCMMSYVIGFTGERTLTSAEHLGYAMQLTNFLRDIQEDIDERGRVYIPQETMKHFGVTEEEIRTHVWSDRMERLMRHEIARARALYRDADAGIPHLAPRGRHAVYIASVLYEAILDKLEAQGANPFVGRARTSWGEKIVLLIKSIKK